MKAAGQIVVASEYDVAARFVTKGGPIAHPVHFIIIISEVESRFGTQSRAGEPNVSVGAGKPSGGAPAKSGDGGIGTPSS